MFDEMATPIKNEHGTASLDDHSRWTGSRGISQTPNWTSSDAHSIRGRDSPHHHRLGFGETKWESVPETPQLDNSIDQLDVVSSCDRGQENNRLLPTEPSPFTPFDVPTFVKELLEEDQKLILRFEKTKNFIRDHLEYLDTLEIEHKDTMSRLNEAAANYDLKTRESWNQRSNSVAKEAVEMAKLLMDMERSKSDMNDQYQRFKSFIAGVQHVAQHVAEKHDGTSL